MSRLTTLPEHLRTPIAALNRVPADDPVTVPPLADLIADDSTPALVPDAPHPPRRSRSPVVRVVAVAASILVIAAIAALAVHLPGRSGRSKHAAAPTAVVPPQVLAAWAKFPVAADPRPLVIIADTDRAPARGFATGDQKLAYLTGNLRLPSTPLVVPLTLAGYPVQSLVQSVAELGHGQARAGTPLQIESVRLVVQAFSTDRGPRPVPAWEIVLKGVRDPAYLLAVAHDARFAPPFGPGPGTRVELSRSGRVLTMHFVSSSPGDGPCNPAFTSRLTTLVTPTAVYLVVVTKVRTTTIPPDTACPLAGTTPFRSAAAHTLTLDEPLGNRVVVDGAGNPYSVVVH